VSEVKDAIGHLQAELAVLSRADHIVDSGAIASMLAEHFVFREPVISDRQRSDIGMKLLASVSMEEVTKAGSC